MKFNSTQKFIAKYYAGGEFAWCVNIHNEKPLYNTTGDGLFEFLIGETGDIQDMAQFKEALQVAINKLNSLQENIEHALEWNPL